MDDHRVAISKPAPVLSSVNVGLPRTVIFQGEEVATAIWKEPVQGSVRVDGVNLSGDDQADRTVHGGFDKAVYAYGAEDYAWWENELGRPMEPGTFGENLTTSGLDVSGSLVGERWRIGSVLLEVAQPRMPCFKLGIRMDDPRFPRRFSLAGRPGAYLRIIEDGEVAAGDSIDVVTSPDHGVTVGDVATIYYSEPERAAELLAASELPEHWLDWARDRKI